MKKYIDVQLANTNIQKHLYAIVTNTESSNTWE